MSDATFVLPEGLVLAQEEHGLTIEYAGNIELHSTLGGRLARVSSTEGDVILHLPLEAGSISATGVVRCKGDLKVGELSAGTVEISGDLSAEELRVEGALRCDGDLTAGQLSAGEVHCAALQVRQVSVGGEVETSGAVHIQRGRVGGLRCGGALDSDGLTVDGELNCLGRGKVSTLQAGNASFGGELELGTGMVERDLDVAGGLRADQVQAGGRVHTDGDLVADQLQAERLEVGGEARIPAMQVVGTVQVAGALSTGTLDVGGLQVGGALKADTVRASGLIQLSGGVQVDRLEGGTIQVEGGKLHARVIQGGEAVHIGAVKVHCDIVIAPVVSLDPTATGRISVIESRTEVGTSRVKGCLSLEDLDELFGNAEQFLAERGVQRLGARPPTDLAGEPGPETEAETTADSDAETSVVLEVQIDDEPVDQALPGLADEHEQAGDEPLTYIPETTPGIRLDLGRASAPVSGADSDDSADSGGDNSGGDNSGGGMVEELEPDVALERIEDLPSAADVQPLDIPTATVRVGEVHSAEEPGEELFGWADQMLSEVVAEGTAHHPPAEVEVSLHEEPELELEQEEDEDELEQEAAEAPAAEDQAAEDQAAAVTIEPARVAVEQDPIHGQLQETVGRIMGCYVHTEMPPAVTRLWGLVEAQDYPKIRSDITEIWNQLLKFHQKRGMRIQPQVTTTFNTINSLVRKL